MKAKKEILLGAFILGALVLLTLGFIFIKDFRFLNQTYTIKVSFNFGDGIKVASPVRMAGVDVGEVDEVGLERKNDITKVIVYAALKKNVRIPSGSEVFINNLGVLGEKYLEIVPAPNSQTYIKPGETIKGQDPIPFYKMSRLAKNIMDDFYLTIVQLKAFVSDEEFKRSLYNLVFNLDKASASMNSILADLQANGGSLGKFLHDDEIYKGLKDFVQDIKNHPWKLFYIPRKDRIELKKAARH